MIRTMMMRAVPLGAALVLSAFAHRADVDVSMIDDAVTSPSADTLPDEPTRRAWPVMGTMLEIGVWEADSAKAQAAMQAARAAVFRVDTLMSVYKPASEISVINRRAGTDTATAVSAWTAEVLRWSLLLGDQSRGAFDPTVGPLVDAWGFHRHKGEFPPQAVRDSAAALVGWRKVAFDTATRRVRLPVRGMRLDFGGIAKGYALDRAVEALRAAGIARGVVDLGGNFRVFGPGPQEGGWIIGLKHPRDPESVFAAVRMDAGAVGTSGDYEQFFVHQGVRYSHIFDPRAGRPARGVASVSVIAPDGLLSDALSKPLFVMGPGEGCRYVARYRGVEAVWVLDTGAPADEAEEWVDPKTVVITDGLADRLEVLSEEPPTHKPRTCGELLGRPASPAATDTTRTTPRRRRR